MMAAILATVLRRERAEISIVIAMATGVLIFGYVLSQITIVLDFLYEMLEMVSIEETYYLQLLKMLGIAYVAEFTSSLCKDTGHQSIAGMIETFARISLVALSIPGIMFLIETLEQFV